MSVLGLNSQHRKSTRDKANIRNPKVNRGCAPLTANRTSADCMQISLGPSIPYIPRGVYHTGGFNAMQVGMIIALHKSATFPLLNRVTLRLTEARSPGAGYSPRTPAETVKQYKRDGMCRGHSDRSLMNIALKQDTLSDFLWHTTTKN